MTLHDPADDLELVPVFRTSDRTLFLVVKSALEAAGIRHVAQGEGGLALFPLGRFAIGMNKRGALGATILVPRRESEEAREFLRSFDTDPPEGEEP